MTTPDIPRLTKMEYAESRGLSLSTVNRMIKDGRLRSELEPHGSSHRVWVYPDVPPVSPYEKLDVSGDTPDIPHVPPDGLDVPNPRGPTRRRPGVGAGLGGAAGHLHALTGGFRVAVPAALGRTPAVGAGAAGAKPTEGTAQAPVEAVREAGLQQEKGRPLDYPFLHR